MFVNVSFFPYQSISVHRFLFIYQPVPCSLTHLFRLGLRTGTTHHGSESKRLIFIHILSQTEAGTVPFAYSPPLSPRLPHPHLGCCLLCYYRPLHTPAPRPIPSSPLRCPPCAPRPIVLARCGAFTGLRRRLICGLTPGAADARGPSLL